MKKIILDTNFLMIPLQFRVDIFSELDRICHFNYRLCVYENSMDELRKIIENGSGKDKKAAQFALKLIKLKNIQIIRSEKNIDVDSLILENSGKDTIVATQDMELKRMLLEKPISVVILRKKQHLQLVGKDLYEENR